MTPEDFRNCYVDEFEAICRAWSEMRDGDTRSGWERTRILASISISPHITNPIPPQELFPLPWDEKKSERKEVPEMSAEEQRKRGAEFARSLGYEV